MFQPVKKALVPVAGLGTRFLPVTKAIPKEMIPVVDKPAIQFIVEEAFLSGIEQVILVNGHHKSSLDDFFDQNFELNHALFKKGMFEELRRLEGISNLGFICSIRQKNTMGLGHALLCARPLIGNEPFAVLLGDDLIFAHANEKPAIGQLIDAYKRSGIAQVAVTQVPSNEIHKYGAADGFIDPEDDRNFVIQRLREKPKSGLGQTNPAVVGRYVLTPAIWSILSQVKPDEGGEIQLTDALSQLLELEGLRGYRFAGKRADTGDRIGYIKATLLYALERDDLRPEVLELIEEIAR